MIETVLWVPLALVAAFTMAGMACLSELRQHRTVPRLFWLRVFSLCAAVPVSLFIEWPHDPRFYVYMILLSTLICGSDALYYGTAKRYGAAVTTRIEPASVLLTFIGWIAITPHQFDAYAQKPLVGVGIALCFLGAGACALRLRRCPVSLPVMKRLAPVMIIGMLVAILAKKAMDCGVHPLDTAVAYLVIQCSFLAIFYIIIARLCPARTGPLRPNRALLASAAAMACCSVLHIASKNIAYTLVPNPAYVTVVGLCAPLIVLGFYRIAGRRDQADIKAGFGIVLCAFALIVLTRF